MTLLSDFDVGFYSSSSNFDVGFHLTSCNFGVIVYLTSYSLDVILHLTSDIFSVTIFFDHANLCTTRDHSAQKKVVQPVAVLIENCETGRSIEIFILGERLFIRFNVMLITALNLYHRFLYSFPPLFHILVVGASPGYRHPDFSKKIHTSPYELENSLLSWFSSELEAFCCKRENIGEKVQKVFNYFLWET